MMDQAKWWIKQHDGSSAEQQGCTMKLIKVCKTYMVHDGAAGLHDEIDQSM